MKINGNLAFNSDATGEIQHAYIERLAASPAFNSAHKGRLYFNTASALYYFNDGTAYVPFATGGNAAALLDEVNALEASIGAVVNADGTYNIAGISGSPIIGAATSITNALQLLATKANGTDTLAELGDVAFGTLVNGQYLKYNSTTGKWYNETLVLADLTDITALAADVNLLGGLAAGGLTGTELSYVGDVTGMIQAQLNNKQPLNTGLTGLANLANGAGTGIVVQTGVNTFTDRSLTAPAAGITITNADGVAGSPTFALANDLGALEGLTTTGYIVRTADGAATTRSLAVAAGQLVITGDASGVTTDTTFGLASISQAASGAFVKVTLDGYGRVTGNTAVVLADLTALADGTYVNVTGDTMTGNLVMNGATVTGLPAPVGDTDAANKAYVDAVAAGLSWKNAVRVASVGDLTLASTTVVDGVTLASGDRVLVKDQAAPAQNGIYTFNGTGLVRAADMDTAAEFMGATTFITEGTVNHDSGWTQTAEVVTVGTTAVTWAQFSGSSTYTWGIGLAATGNTIDINMGAGIAQLPSDEVGIDLYDEPNGALILTTDGAAHSTVTGAKLYLRLDAAGALAQTASGLKVAAASVANAMLVNPSVGLNGDTGTSSLALGQTLQVTGSSVQGIVTAVTGQTVNVTASNASSSQKGVASFDAGDFTVTAGNVVIAAAGVDNAQLANSTVGYAGTTGGTQTVALGSSFSIVGGSAPVTTVSQAGSVNSITINVADATISTKGLASFATADFTVTAGAVAIIAKPLDSLTDVTIGTAAAGDTLVYSAGSTQFVNRPTYFLYSSTGSSVTHTVVHNLGQKYCNVTVVDSTDEVVIPQSITFNDATQLTVTFTSSIACKVVAMGVNAA